MKTRSTTNQVSAIVAGPQISAVARAGPRLHVGQKYYVYGEPFVFERYLDEGYLLFKCPRTQLPLRVDPHDPRSALPDLGWLIEALADGIFTTKAPARNGVLSNRRLLDEQQARDTDPGSVIRYHILVRTDKCGARPDDFAISTVIDDVFAEFPNEAAIFGNRPTTQTVKTWRKNRGTYGDRAWSDCLSLSGRSRTVRLSKQILSLVVESALHFWSDLTLNYWRGYQKLQNRIAEWNSNAENDAQKLECPAFSTFLRYANYLATYDAVRAKLGEKAAKALIAVGKLAQASRILETVQADHTRIDVIALDDVTGAVIGRPTLTIILDIKSRCVLGYYISFAPPCFAAVVECFRRCLRPKLGCAGSDNFPILQDIFGLPSLLVVDNAMEFVGVNMQDSMNDVGVALTFPPVKTPEAKPFVERLLGTLNTTAFHAVEGTTFNRAAQVKRGGEYKPEPRITLSGLNQLIDQVMYSYHISPHDGLNGRPPALLWQEDAVRYGIPVLFDLDRLDALLAASALRVLARDGVQLYGLMYNHGPTANSVLAEMKAAGIDTNEKLKIKYNPNDLSCVWLFHPIKREYLRLPATDPDYAAGLSQYQHQKIREHMKAEGLAFSSPDQRLKARQAVENKIYEITPGLLQKQRTSLARLASKVSIREKLENLGLASITGLSLLPHDPLIAREADGGALPEGTARGAAKAKKTREAKVQAQKVQNISADDFNSDDDDWLNQFDDTSWKGYDYE